MSIENRSFGFVAPTQSTYLPSTFTGAQNDWQIASVEAIGEGHMVGADGEYIGHFADHGRNATLHAVLLPIFASALSKSRIEKTSVTWRGKL